MSKHASVEKCSATPELPFVRSPYNYDTMAVSNETGLYCPEPTLTQQHSKDECDINVILEKMARGVMPDANPRTPRYGDFTTTANDYHNALNMVIAAQDSFDRLPANIRARFDNDPEKLLAFVQDSKNLDEAIQLGLAVPPAQDLSTGLPDRLSSGQAGKPVGKSVDEGKPSPRPPKPASRGDEGDE